MSTTRKRPESVVIGLIGEGIQQSRTPAMHEAEAARKGLPLAYKLLDTLEMGGSPPPLAELLRYARLFGFSGLNITYPFKQEVIPLLDEMSDAAAAIGAVNTVVIRNGRLSGHNTDYWGFRESFQSRMSGVLRDNVLLLGAGGAGAAVSQALLDSGVGRLWVADEDADRAAALVIRLCEHHGAGRARVAEDVETAAAAANGIVNATPVGMAKLPGTPIPSDWLRPEQWVTDIVYFPLETAFLKAAHGKGCAVMNGSGMAVWQAVRAFELFTGSSADPEAMQRTFVSLGT